MDRLSDRTATVGADRSANDYPAADGGNATLNRLSVSDTALATVTVLLRKRHYREGYGKVLGWTEFRAYRNVQLRNDRRRQEKTGPETLLTTKMSLSQPCSAWMKDWKRHDCD